MAFDEAEIKAKLKEREEHIRESWVKAMELRLVQKMLEECHQAEGVNHSERCQPIAERYMSMLAGNNNRVKGYKVIDVSK